MGLRKHILSQSHLLVEFRRKLGLLEILLAYLISVCSLASAALFLDLILRPMVLPARTSKIVFVSLRRH